MANDSQQTGFVVNADTNPFAAAMRGLVDHARAGQKGVEGALGDLTGPITGLQAKFAAMAAVIGGGAMFKASVEASKNFTGEAVKLSKALGINTTEASTLNVALGDIYASADDMVDASAKLGRQLLKNEGELNRVGLVTRDASGNFRNMKDLMMDSITVLNGYKEGTDRNLAAQSMYGKGAGEMTKLLKLNNEVLDEAKQKQEALGLVVGVENVEATKAYKAASNDVSDVLLAMKKTVGDAVMPVLTQLAEMFAAAMPPAVFAFRIAVQALATALQGIVLLCKLVWDGLAALANPLFTLGNAVRKLLTGDLTGATKDMQSIFTNWGAALGGVWDQVKADSSRTWKEVTNLWSKPTAMTVKDGGKSFTSKPEAPKSTAEKEPSYMKTYETALEQRKLVFEQEHAMREFSKADELAYWREILSTYTVVSKDRTAIALKTSRLEVDILREKTRQQKDIQLLHADDWKAETLDYVNELNARAQYERDLGLITQAEFLERQKAFNERRLQAELELLQQKVDIAKLDPEKNVVLLEQLEMQKLEIRRKYAALNQQLVFDQAKESAKYLTGIFDSLQSGFASVFAQIGTQIKTIGGLVKGMWNVVVSSVMGAIGKMAAEWLMNQVRMLVFGKAMALSKIAQLSGEAGAGGVASMAAAPFPLNLSAPAFGAAMAAAALAFAPVAAASQGFDIPRGLNPITQLHQEEMVLPAPLANVVRDLARGTGGSAGAVGGSGGDTYIIQALDSRSFEQFAKDNPAGFAAGVKNAARRGHL